MHKTYPFKFLDSYNREDGDIFFGRTEEVEYLYKMIFESDIILVYGASGTGKTSLIQCGLANKFQSHDWLPILIRRGSNLNHSFQQEMVKVSGIEGGDIDKMDRLANSWNSNLPVKNNKGAASQYSRLFQAAYLNHFKPIYLIFDQFEELYIQKQKTDEENEQINEQKEFISTIKEILALNFPIKIIISIREEYYGYLYDFEKAIPELLKKKLRLEPMTLEKVKNVIQGLGTLEHSNITLKECEEDSIAEQIFLKIRGDEKVLGIQLTYLQLFLDKLYLQITNDTTRKAEAMFSIAELDKMGDIGDVLKDFLEDQVMSVANKLNQKSQVIWHFLSPFVTLEGTKESISESYLFDSLPTLNHDLVKEILNVFVSNNRIIRYIEEKKLFEIIHDSLAKKIYDNRSEQDIALMEIRRLIKSQTSLNKEKREYFTEKQLQFIDPYKENLKLNSEEIDWVKKSEDAVKRKKNKKTIIMFIAIIVIVTTGIVINLQLNQKAEENLKRYNETRNLLESRNNLDFNNMQRRLNIYIEAKELKLIYNELDRMEKLVLSDTINKKLIYRFEAIKKELKMNE